MTDHLPECPYRVDHPALPRNRGLICICDELRACEQRLIREGRTRGSGVWHDGYGMGYADALDGAEAAVAASWSWPDWADDGKGEQEVMFMGDAISAIRALKEKK